jgi:hypothetical protein
VSWRSINETTINYSSKSIGNDRNLKMSRASGAFILFIIALVCIPFTQFLPPTLVLHIILLEDATFIVEDATFIVEDAIFIVLFVYRYSRLLVHCVSSYVIYKPKPKPENPTFRRKDCSVIIPTVDVKNNKGFRDCLVSIFANGPRVIIIVTVGPINFNSVLQTIAQINTYGSDTRFIVKQIDAANKRLQICEALKHVTTKFTVFADDHVYWGHNFLPTALAPFESPQVGGVGTNKRVRRIGYGLTKGSIFNFWAVCYLERHNFDLRATCAIDGGVFVLSGRTSLWRSVILKDPDFRNKFVNEMFFFNWFGPLGPDDDNFITRWLVNHGWKMFFQDCEDATVETDLGDPTKFFSQCLRWSRTTWRSNSCSLFTDRVVWKSQPWCVYAVYWTSFFNFAVFYDWALIYTFSRTSFCTRKVEHGLKLLIFVSKLVKLVPHFRRYPRDLILIPACLFMAYFHSFIKIYALLTFWEVRWEGRNLAVVEEEAAKENKEK